MNVVLVNDYGKLRAALEAAGHKTYTVGPVGADFSVRMEMMRPDVAISIVRRSTYHFGGKADFLVYGSPDTGGEFGSMLMAGLAAQHCLDVAFISNTPNAEAVPAKRKGTSTPKGPIDQETGDEIGARPESVVDLTIVKIQPGLPYRNASTYVLAAGLVGLASSLEDDVKVQGLPVKVLVVDDGDMGWIQA